MRDGAAVATIASMSPRTLPLLLLPLLGAAIVLPSSATAAERPLDAPMDVRVTAKVQSATLNGAWDVVRYDLADADGSGGSWVSPQGDGPKAEEAWHPLKATSLRIRGKARGGRRAMRVLPLKYTAQRATSGTLIEVHEPDETIFQTLSCVEPPGPKVGTSAMTVTDDPAHNRVVIGGPSIAFVGPRCVKLDENGEELYARSVGFHPPHPKNPLRPLGAAKWELAVPRAEFAAGGDFTFRGVYATKQYLLTNYAGSETDVHGYAKTSGKVTVKISVRRIGH